MGRIAATIARDDRFIFQRLSRLWIDLEEAMAEETFFLEKISLECGGCPKCDNERVQEWFFRNYRSWEIRLRHRAGLFQERFVEVMVLKHRNMSMRQRIMTMRKYHGNARADPRRSEDSRKFHGREALVWHDIEKRYTYAKRV